MKISNLIISLQNAILANKPKITLPNSKYLINFLEILVEARYILAYSSDKKGKIHIFLGLTNKKNRILSLRLISTPSKPIYYSCQDLWKYERSLSLLILNTPKGIIPHKTALAQGLGGQALCIIQ